MQQRKATVKGDPGIVLEGEVDGWGAGKLQLQESRKEL